MNIGVNLGRPLFDKIEKLIYKLNAYNIMFVRKKRFKRGEKYATYYYLEKQEKIGGKFRTKTVMYLGSAEGILKNYQELAELKKKQRLV